MNKLIFGIVIVAMLIAFSAPASAISGPIEIDQLNRYEEVVPNGSYWLDWDNNGGTTVNFNVPNVDLYKVRIYNSAWMPSAHITATYPNASTPLPDRYPLICDYTRYTGLGTTGVWYPNDTVRDVTIPGAINTYSTSDSGHGTALTILYQDPDNPNSLDSWFYQGYDDSENLWTSCDGYIYCRTYTFHNVTASNHTHWTLMVAVTCADDGNIVFNNNPQLPNGYDISTKFYHVATNDVSGMVVNGDNTVKMRTNDEYFHPYWMWLVGETAAGAPPVAGFTANVTTGPAPLAVHFTDTSSGEITSRNWDFDNNGEIDSTDQHPDYTYTDPGVYTVRLNVTGPNGSDEEIKVDYITVTERIPSTPFLISGWINNSAGNPVNNPLVNVTNTNTSEVFTAEATADSNYYQVMVSSENVGAGNVLHFYARDDSGNVEEFDHTVTGAEMDAGGFEENITIRFPYTDLVVTEIDAYHNATGYPACFNLYNEIDVTVENIGTNAATLSHVALYIDSEFYGKQSVPAIDPGCNTTVQFGWTPTGTDCEDGGTPITYTLRAVADCDGEIDEANEGNNESTTEETAYWAGYSADESLNTAFHGTIHGGLNFTTGDGVYTGLHSPGASTDIHYDITLPDGASVELARLNVYYTWSNIDGTGVYPSMEVNITNASGTCTLSTAAEYNDRPCDTPAINFDYPYGNYVYDLTPYVTESGTYNVTVKNVGPSEHSSFCIDPPGLVMLYNDSTKPEYEYWILEGADVLEGGRRGGAGNLALGECINNATIEGTIDLSRMASATLGLATPWGGRGSYPSYLYFNGVEIGKDVYHGDGETYSETLNGMSMHIGSTDAQMGVNLTDVTTCLAASDNVVGQGDDGDMMLVANVFMLLERGDDVANADAPVTGTMSGSYEDTHVSDDVCESITEEESKGKPANRYSHLEHKWTVDVTGGSDITFYLEAYRSSSSDGDDFVFAYSTDDSNYTDMATVTNTSDSNTYQTYCLPGDLSGTVYIRVKDTDQTAGNKTLDTIYIDHLFIRSESGPPSYGVTVTIDEASQIVAPGNGTTYTVRVKNTGDLNASYSVVMSGTAVTETTIGVVPSGWNTGTLAPNAEDVQTVTVSTEANTPEMTCTLTAAASCDQDASVTDSATSELVVSSATNAMHIASIDMTLKPNTYAIALVTIVDATGAPVGSATVDGHWSDATTDTDSEPTNVIGEAKLKSDKVRNPPPGTTFTFTVDGVSLTGWTYDSGANVVTSGSIPVP